MNFEIKVKYKICDSKKRNKISCYSYYFSFFYQRDHKYCFCFRNRGPNKIGKRCKQQRKSFLYSLGMTVLHATILQQIAIAQIILFQGQNVNL